MDKASDSLGVLSESGNGSSNDSIESVTSSSGNGFDDSFLASGDNLDHFDISCKGDSLQAVIIMNEEERGLQDDDARNDGHIYCS